MVYVADLHIGLNTHISGNIDDNKLNNYVINLAKKCPSNYFDNLLFPIF